MGQGMAKCCPSADKDGDGIISAAEFMDALASGLKTLGNAVSTAASAINSAAAAVTAFDPELANSKAYKNFQNAMKQIGGINDTIQEAADKDSAIGKALINVAQTIEKIGEDTKEAADNKDPNLLEGLIDDLKLLSSDTADFLGALSDSDNFHTAAGADASRLRLAKEQLAKAITGLEQFAGQRAARAEAEASAHAHTLPAHDSANRVLRAGAHASSEAKSSHVDESKHDGGRILPPPPR